MDLKDFLVVSGHPGLFKMVSQGKNILIVESLETGHRMPVHGSTKVSSLEEIAVFAESGDKPLKEVLLLIHDSEGGSVGMNPKTATNEELRGFMGRILPDYDRDRVYISDIRKLVLWYNSLVQWGKIEWVADVQETGDNQESPETETENQEN
jgi:hypothetical protein